MEPNQTSRGPEDWLLAELQATRERLKAAQAKLAERADKLDEARARILRIKAERDEEHGSLSWKLASPLRKLERALRPASAANSSPQERDRPQLVAPSTPPALTSPTKEKPAAPATAGDGAKRAWEIQQRLALQNFLATGARLDLTPPGNIRTSVLLVLYNRAELTLGCLESLLSSGEDGLEVVIVDNRSTDETSMLLDRIDGATIFRNAENAHYLKGCNQAAKAAHGEYLLFLNNDTRLLPGAIRAGLAAFDRRNDVGAVGGRIILPDGTLQEAGSVIWSDASCAGYGRGADPSAPEFHFRREVDYCSAAFLLTPRRVFEEMGGYDERLAPAYYEETDYCMRLHSRGMKVLYEPRAAILHFEFASSETRDRAIALQERNRAIFGSTHAPALAHQPASGRAMLEARQHWHRGPRVLFVEDRVPHAFLGSGYPRSREFLCGLLHQGCFVTLYPFAFPSEDFATIYRDIPPEIEVMTGYRKSRLAEFLRDRRGFYDAMIVTRPHNAPLLFDALESQDLRDPAVPVIYDAEAVFSDRTRTRNETRGESAPWEDEYREEMDLARRADRIVSVSAADAKRFAAETGKPVSVLGHLVEPHPGNVAHEERTTLLFVGAIHEEDTPNADSLLWFFQEVWPLLKPLGAKVEVAGLCASARMLAFESPDVRFLGMVDDLRPAYDCARVFLAPTRFAAGIPMKVHEAAAHGVPVVATPLLARQLNWQIDRDLLTGASAKDFAASISRLWSDGNLWNSVRAAALTRIEEDCSSVRFHAGIAEIIKAARVRSL